MEIEIMLPKEHSTVKTTHLFTPFRFAGMSLKNRLLVAPMSRVSTMGDGIPTEQMKHYYTAFARGQFALLVTEGTYIDDAYSQAYPDQPAIVTTEQVEAWRDLVAHVHQADAKIVLQLMHAGALIQENRHRSESIAPSSLLPRGKKMPEYGGGDGPYAIPRAMTEADIQDVIASFARAALHARRAGFDGVEIHGANGYLIDQFITDYTNQRTDRYGGVVENRIRFAVEVVQAIREAVGPDYPVIMRLSQTKVNDFAYRWPGGRHDGEVIFSALAQAGISALHLASEGRNWQESALIAPGLTITRLARDIAQVPVIANGGLHDPELAEKILADGQADLIALARGALANPDWPMRLQEGRPFEAFQHQMIEPLATIEQTMRWRNRHQ
jgi:2,4-dienoyl-CoA reductase-like NADH-dependent reductase (Old Yellow Enzyme family)